jgi:hypothetical protein
LAMKLLFALLIVIYSPNVYSQKNAIDRKSVVGRHEIITHSTNPDSPAQVGNGKFAFDVDITGLQTFVPFNTLSDWGWHSFPLPDSLKVSDFEELTLETHGKEIPYHIPNPNQSVLSSWLAGNPHRCNLGRIGLLILKKDGSEATEKDIVDAEQKVNLWNGIIESRFVFEGEEVLVTTSCHADKDMLGVSVKSKLIKKAQISVFIDFPYADIKGRGFTRYIGDYTKSRAHSSTIKNTGVTSAKIVRAMDDLKYNVFLSWESPLKLERESKTEHRFLLRPETSDKLAFSCLFSTENNEEELPRVSEIKKSSSEGWSDFWLSGAAIDLSESKDNRWKELERRIVLSQYLMRLNEAGLYPPQEAGLINNGWYGRYHFEMIWWHGVHYGLWNRWDLFDNYLDVYRKFLLTSIKRAQKQGYKGARWPKCTANIDRDWPHIIHATLIWQQPHPIYFAEMDYRIHPNKQTLDKWKDIVINTADFMADFAFYDTLTERYVLGPPITIVSENTDHLTTSNPAFELGYWRYGLRVALEWSKRLSLPENPEWRDVLDKLSPLPVQDGLYVTYEGIQDMWTKYNFEHPALSGVYGMLPGDGVDTNVFSNTLNKVVSVWNFNHTWGWDFPMLAMAAARSGDRDLAINMLLHDSKGFQFDEHGLCTGGPFPYFPSNGGFLTAIAMMCGGWDGVTGENPGFPQNGNWSIKSEKFLPMQ